MPRIERKGSLAGKRYRPKPRDEVARNMAAIRSHENRTEAALRRAVHALGLRYRKYAHHLPGKPDILFPSARLAVSVSSYPNTIDFIGYLLPSR